MKMTGRRRVTILFALVGLTCCLSLSLVRWRTRLTAPKSFSAGPLREHALILGATGEDPNTIDDSEFNRILCLVEPRWKVVKLNDLLHALRLWASVRSSISIATIWANSMVNVC